MLVITHYYPHSLRLRPLDPTEPMWLLMQRPSSSSCWDAGVRGATSMRSCHSCWQEKPSKYVARCKCEVHQSPETALTRTIHPHLLYLQVLSPVQRRPHAHREAQTAKVLLFGHNAVLTCVSLRHVCNALGINKRCQTNLFEVHEHFDFDELLTQVSMSYSHK